MTDSPDQPSPMAAAMEWVSRIFAVAVEMVLPGLAGIWLDEKLGTGFLVLVGFGLGIALGIWHLLTMSKRIHGGTKSRRLGSAETGKSGSDTSSADASSVDTSSGDTGTSGSSGD